MQINWYYSVFFLLPFQAGGTASPGGNTVPDQPSPQVSVRQFSLEDAAIPPQLANDNDGLWTAMYAAGKLYECAVRKQPAALAAARKSMEAILFLEQIPGVAGFPARSYIRKGERQPGDGEWHATPDGQ